MAAIKREAVNYLVPLGDDVFNIDPHVRKALEQGNVMVSQSRDAGPNAAGKAVMDNRTAVQLQVAFQVPDLKTKGGALQQINILAFRHKSSNALACQANAASRRCPDYLRARVVST